MDKYEELFKKGADAYVEALIRTGWFDSPYVDEHEVINSIKSCKAPYHFATRLTQAALILDSGFNQFLFDELMDTVCQFVSKSSYSFTKEGTDLYIVLTINGNNYTIKIDLMEFEYGEGNEDSCFMNYFINKALDEEQLEYRFYELPPDDEAHSYVFVKPETYRKALEFGVIPDFLGYYVVNDY